MISNFDSMCRNNSKFYDLCLNAFLLQWMAFLYMKIKDIKQPILCILSMISPVNVFL